MNTTSLKPFFKTDFKKMTQEMTCEAIEKHLKAFIQSSVEKSEADKKKRKGRDSRNTQHQPPQRLQQDFSLPNESSTSGSKINQNERNKNQKERKKKNKLHISNASRAPNILEGGAASSRKNYSNEAVIQHNLSRNGFIPKNIVDISTVDIPLKINVENAAANECKGHPTLNQGSAPSEKQSNKRNTVASVLKESGKQRTVSNCEESSSDSNAAVIRKRKKKKSKHKKDFPAESRSPSPEDKGGKEESEDENYEKHFRENFHHMLDRNGETVSMTHNDTAKWLETEFIICLKKQSDRFPESPFYCQLCNYHCSLLNVERHIKQQNHLTSKEVEKNKALLHFMPQPTESQVKVLSSILEELCEREGLSENDLQIRQDTVNRLNELVKKELPGVPCKFQLFGSSISGLGLKSSDVNIDLIVQSVEALSDGLSKLKELLESDDKIMDVKSEFEAKNPSLSFVERENGLRCFISWNNTLSHRTAKLLANYAAFDPRVKILSVAVRYWAQLCSIDDQEKGTLPAHSFIIMLIYFLQQCNPPVIPVLHEFFEEVDSDKYLTASEAKTKWVSENKYSVGYLWVEFLRFYSVTFTIKEKVVSIRRLKPLLRSEKKWDGKVIAIEDPMCRKRNLCRSIPNQVVYRYIYERLQHAYQYFGIPQLKTGPLYESLPDEYLRELRKCSKKPRLEFNFADAKIFSPSDEALTNQPLESCSENHPKSSNFGLRNPDRKKGILAAFDHDESSSDEDDFIDDQDPELSLDHVVETLLNMDLGDGREDLRRDSERSETLDEEKENNEARNVVTAKDDELTEKIETTDPNKTPTPCEEFLNNLMNSFVEEDLNFYFDKEILTDGKVPPLYCKICQQKGHLKDICPTQILPDLIDLPPMTKQFEEMLTSTCRVIVEKYSPKESEIQDRADVLSELQEYIQNVYSDAKLELFGSSCNGFGFTRSDMDICLTFDNNATGEELDFVKIIENLAQHLKGVNHLHGILPITTAKVPIVKFSYRKELECDISLYNTLAQHNTRMLKLYCEIDERVQLLGYTLKFFAKLCDIGDASRGSLSSYAYILMVLHFLQQRKPPIIPVLQELYDKDSKKPEVIVDGWNAWFYEDLPKLGETWPEYKSNTESAGELWLGLLRYYTEEFNFKDNVITIKQLSNLTRFEKVWNSKSIAIEDPFDLSHNLGVGLSQNMNTYIMKALIRGRELFGTPLEFVPYDPFNFLFDSHKLVVEAPPNDRGCRICSKIGHKMKDCPNRRNGRNRGKNMDHNMQVVDRNKIGNRDQFRDTRGYNRENRNTGFNGQGVGGNARQGPRQNDRRGPSHDKLGRNQEIMSENVRNLLNSAVPKQLYNRPSYDDRFQSQPKEHSLRGSGNSNNSKITNVLKGDKHQSYPQDVQLTKTGPKQMFRYGNAPPPQRYSNEKPSQGYMLAHQTQNIDNSRKQAQIPSLLGSHPSQLNKHPSTYSNQQGHGNPMLNQPGQSGHRFHHQVQPKSDRGLVTQPSTQPHQSNNFGHHQNFHQQRQTNLQSNQVGQPQGQQAAQVYQKMVSNQMMAGSNSSNQYPNMHQQIQYRVNQNQTNLPHSQNQIPGYSNPLLFPPPPQGQQSVFNLAMPPHPHVQNKSSTPMIPDEAQRLGCRPPMPSPFNPSVWMSNGPIPSSQQPHQVKLGQDGYPLLGNKSPST